MKRLVRDMLISLLLLATDGGVGVCELRGIYMSRKRRQLPSLSLAFILSLSHLFLPSLSLILSLSPSFIPSLSSSSPFPLSLRSYDPRLA